MHNFDNLEELKIECLIDGNIQPIKKLTLPVHLLKLKKVEILCLIDDFVNFRIENYTDQKIILKIPRSSFDIQDVLKVFKNQKVSLVFNKLHINMDQENLGAQNFKDISWCPKKFKADG